MYFYSYEINEFLEDLFADFAFWIIKKTNRYKNRCLAGRLFELSNSYNPRPLSELQDVENIIQISNNCSFCKRKVFFYYEAKNGGKGA